MLESRYNLGVTVAIHGQEALEVMASGIQFDLILMDLMMPVMGGYDCFTEIIRIYGDKRPVVWVSIFKRREPASRIWKAL